jgi:DNA sulfur modification protein DndD
MLDAINLVLYGNRANLSNRDGKSWDKYLTDSINRHAQGSASVGMALLLEDEFGVRRYDLTRSWEKKGKKVDEFFDIRVNGELDKVLAEQWPDFIENLLPIEVASLNFFDGEKVEQLAHPEKSKNVIASALRGMLGLGLLDKLEADLKVYLRRSDNNDPVEEANPEIASIQTELEVLEARRSTFVSDVASQNTELERSLELVRREEAAAAALGSDNWERRTELTNEQTGLQMRRYEIEQSLVQTTAGSAPLRLVSDLISRTLTRAQQDRDTQLSRSLVEILEQRDKAILKELSASTQTEVAPLLDDDLSRRRTMASGETVFDQPEIIAIQLESALQDATEDLEVSVAMNELAEIDSSLVDVGRRIESLPADDQIAPVLERLGGLRARHEVAEAAYKELTEEQAHLEGQLERLTSKLNRLLEAEADKAIKGASAVRAREYARRSLEDIQVLAKKTLSRNIPQIEATILDRFNSLIGKSDLISKISIDNESLEMAIHGGDGEPLPVDRLSAGERQLLAMATLWGLATVAGRPMPLVIDSPLGKLDKTHRSHIASRYFPKASEQVIILSTDSEVVEDLYDIMKPSISRQYELDFRDGEKSTVITAGFFSGDNNAN